MTREEAIKILRKEIECLSHATCSDCPLEKVCDPIMTTPFDSEYIEVYEMAIKALEQQPCEDCISRQIISDYVGSHIQEINTGYGDLNKHTNEILRMIVDYIESIPPVTPKPKTGQWIKCMPEGGDEEWCYKCSKCKFWRYKKTINLSKFKFCPNCGAKMEV